MKIEHFTVGPFLEHTYLVSDPKTKEALIIDPGGWSDQVLGAVKDQKLRVKAIISTHGHIDHIAGAFEVRSATEAPYRLNAQDRYLLDSLDQISGYFGFPKVDKPIIDDSIGEGDILRLGEHEIRVIETPGHTPGGICLLFQDQVFVGDTLFYDSVGRTDLPGGNTEQLLESIRSKLLILPEETTVHCGHGATTTIGREKRENPFLTQGQVRWF